MAGLTNKQKVAVLLLYLGADTASQILKYLEEYQIMELSAEISHLGIVKSEVINDVIKEFHKYMLEESGAKGGMGYLRSVLEKTLGASRALSILNRLEEVQPFTYLKDISIAKLATILANEHPQTIAVVLSYIPSVQAAGVLSQLPEEIKLAVSLRIANSREVESDTINEINKALQKTVVSQRSSSGGAMSVIPAGTKSLAEILTRADFKTETAILDNIKQSNPSLAEEVRKNMFLFADVVFLDDKAVQRIIREVESKDLTLSLKLADDTVKEKIFKNMSERAREILKEEMEYLGPVRIRQVEETQQKILEIIRRLEQAGEIVIPKRGMEEKFV